MDLDDCPKPHTEHTENHLEKYKKNEGEDISVWYGMVRRGISPIIFQDTLITLLLNINIGQHDCNYIELAFFAGGK